MVLCSYLCISLELGSQNLWQYVHSRGGRLPEDEAQSIFVQLIDGVYYCHSQGVANRFNTQPFLRFLFVALGISSWKIV